MLKWALLMCAIVAEVSGSMSLKAALDRPIFYLVVVIGFGSAFVFLTFVLRLGMGIGVAYGIWGAVGVAATALLSAAIYDEPLTPLMMAGLVLIIIGVLVIQIGAERSRSSARLQDAA